MNIYIFIPHIALAIRDPHFGRQSRLPEMSFGLAFSNLSLLICRLPELLAPSSPLE